MENKEILDENYWSDHYGKGTTGWDVGYVSTPLKSYIDQLTDHSLRILIPGAGNSYEAEYLWQKGFEQVHVIDIAQEPLDNLKQRVPDFPESQLIKQDFFGHEGEYDLILEQTFFCALNPVLRENYIEKMSALLVPQGKIAGLLFNIPLYDDHPPFGGNKEQYMPMFSKFFEIVVMELAHNSIPPRAGSELFINLIKLKV